MFSKRIENGAVFTQTEKNNKWNVIFFFKIWGLLKK